jgi:hypothetical protein
LVKDLTIEPWMHFNGPAEAIASTIHLARSVTNNYAVRIATTPVRRRVHQ